MSIDSLKTNIINILKNKKAIDVEDIYVAEKSIIADYFIIASGTSSTQVKALAENLEFEISKLGVKPKKVEGYDSGNWILLDYGDIVVHIFLPEARKLYALSELWSEK